MAKVVIALFELKQLRKTSYSRVVLIIQRQLSLASEFFYGQQLVVTVTHLPLLRLLLLSFSKLRTLLYYLGLNN
jgi:hypothetical protein